MYMYDKNNVLKFRDEIFLLTTRSFGFCWPQMLTDKHNQKQHNAVKKNEKQNILTILPHSVPDKYGVSGQKPGKVRYMTQ